MIKAISYFIEIINWLKILLSPLIIGVAIGLMIYFNYPYFYGKLLGIIIAVVGLIVGIIWATSVWKKQGCSFFMSGVEASPNIDIATKSKENEL